MTPFHVRRDKAALFSSGCKAHPATAPAGSNRGRHGGDDHQPILQRSERVLNTALRGRRRRIAEKGMTGAAIGTRRFAAVRASYAVF